MPSPRVVVLLGCVCLLAVLLLGCLEEDGSTVTVQEVLEVPGEIADEWAEDMDIDPPINPFCGGSASPLLCPRRHKKGK